MPQSENIYRPHITIKVNGTEISQESYDQLEQVLVDQHSHLPHMFAIRFYDPGLSFLDSGPLNLTAEVEILGGEHNGAMHSLIKGEITSLEPEFDEGQVARLVVRGYDKSHRLYRITQSKAYINKKDSDLAQTMAGSAGLATEIEATNTVYDHIYQDNQTDLGFLMQRAWRIGYECFVRAGKLYFRKPPTSGPSLTLEWGESLLYFAPRMTLAEQVDEVTVKGWDIQEKAPIVGQKTSGALNPALGESKNGQQWAATFGAGKLVVVDQPVVSQAEANIMAQARLDERSGAFVVAEGRAPRCPQLTAGEKVTLEGLGQRLSGNYLVTQVRHVYTQDGWEAHFSVRGARSGLLAEEMVGQRPLSRWPGIVIAVVTNTNDPNTWGRVKVKYPWMADDVESDWARVVSAGAGPQAGFCLIPDVNDEVMVAFEQGDINRPYVLGGVWNGKDAMPTAVSGAASGKRPLIRTWRSRTGHHITMHETDDKKVELGTKDGHLALFDDVNKRIQISTAGGHQVVIDDQNKKIEIKSSGGHTITLDDSSRKITVKSAGDVQVESTANMTIKSGANLDIQATGNLNIKANGLGQVESTGPMTVKSTAITTVQGSLVKIN
jgi:phage protein D/phage baseplate assembly protein gpV